MNEQPEKLSLPKPECDFMNVDQTDFSTMSRPEQIRYFEVEGYVVLPSILTPEIIGALTVTVPCGYLSGSLGT